MKRELLTAVLLSLMSTPVLAQETKTDKVVHTVVKYVEFPIYVGSYYMIGHLFGGPIGAVKGLHRWEAKFPPEPVVLKGPLPLPTDTKVDTQVEIENHLAPTIPLRLEDK